ncbi:hypothetical protein [Flavobacterium psychrotrophum]|uniref:hypothetical protein n=1 Tax=Flavobacterium psychrotrophum TaxID=2294119 RepID=UPI000E30C16A|nr:hypothetical protein [Flavobacterium psychrotrophum]
MDKKQHWETVYSTKKTGEVSWYQLIPHTSLQLIESSGIGISSAIIDVGGGDSLLADNLLELGYTATSVLAFLPHMAMYPQKEGESSKTWLKSLEVRTLLDISAVTLQNFG